MAKKYTSPEYEMLDLCTVDVVSVSCGELEKSFGADDCGNDIF